MSSSPATTPLRLHPVILSGGAGTRLWPASRTQFPKQFVPDLLPGSKPLFERTLKRLSGPGHLPPTVVCNAEHAFLVRDLCGDAGIAPRRILLEPAARNTAPAIAAAAIDIASEDPEAILVVMPSDHVIPDEDAFAADVAHAAQLARDGHLVLFGIEPSRPHTGFGYIEPGGSLAGERPAFAIRAFHEKPDQATAERWLAEGRRQWNAGIFVMGARAFLAALEVHAPAIRTGAEAACASGRPGPDGTTLALGAEAFAALPSISIDHAVMEAAETTAVVPASFGWSDVGGWHALWEEGPHDGAGNAVSGDVVLEGTSGTLVRAERGLVAAVGVRDLVIVSTADAVVVADRAQAEGIGALVRSLAAAGRPEAEVPHRNRRPWGWYETLALGDRFQVKKLHVRPGGKLSLQRHHHRSEHWVVIAGTARVTVGDVDRLVCENESAYITATQWHRLENPGMVPLEIIEVQIGSYLGEDDIERADDVYGRLAAPPA